MSLNLRQQGKKAFLVLGKASAEEFGLKTLDFYASKGMALRCETLADLASHVGAQEDVLAEEIAVYNGAAAAARGREASASEAGVGKSSRGSTDAFGKRVFPHAVDLAGPFYASTVAPVVHYTMGGVRIDSEAQALDAKGKAILGLFAAGEVSGG